MISSDHCKITKLQVQNFRNLENKTIHFGPSINCILGNNGNGKTNILEAIYLLSTKKSFRKNTSFPQFLSIDGEKTEVTISAAFKNSHQEFSLSSIWNCENVRWFLNGQHIKKRLGIKTVFINPFDSYNFHNSASFRRSWFDTYIAQIYSGYKKKLNQYNQIIRFKNSLLSKRPSKFREQIYIYNKELAPLIVELVKIRECFLSEIGFFCLQTFKDIFDSEHDLKIVLETPFLKMSEEQTFHFLQEKLSLDEKVGHTKYGIHRDDYVLLFDGINSLDYCSLGQQKMSYLSLIFAYIELFRYKLNSFPIVLIDDVSGELDSKRWKKLIDYLQKREFQVLITTANEKFKEELVRMSTVVQLFIESGNVSNN